MFLSIGTEINEILPSYTCHNLSTTNSFLNEHIATASSYVNSKNSNIAVGNSTKLNEVFNQPVVNNDYEKVQLFLTYHNLRELGIEFALLWHRLREFL